MQGDPADSVFFIEDGDCQVGYNQRRTADEDLISTVSNPISALVYTCHPCELPMCTCHSIHMLLLPLLAGLLSML